MALGEGRGGGEHCVLPWVLSLKDQLGHPCAVAGASSLPRSTGRAAASVPRLGAVGFRASGTVGICSVSRPPLILAVRPWNREALLRSRSPELCPRALCDPTPAAASPGGTVTTLSPSLASPSCLTPPRALGIFLSPGLLRPGGRSSQTVSWEACVGTRSLSTSSLKGTNTSAGPAPTGPGLCSLGRRHLLVPARCRRHGGLQSPGSLVPPVHAAWRVAARHSGVGAGESGKK